MSKLLGIQVNYRYPVQEEATIHAEIKCKMSDAIKMDIIFETNPKLATLKKIGWISEYKDDKPYIAILPYDAPHLQSKCTIEIPPIGAFTTKGRLFEITTITALMEYPDSYLCTLAPIYTNNDELSEVKNDYSGNDDDSSANYNHVASELEPDKYEGRQYIEVVDEAVNEEEEPNYNYFGFS